MSDSGFFLRQCLDMLYLIVCWFVCMFCWDLLRMLNYMADGCCSNGSPNSSKPPWKRRFYLEIPPQRAFASYRMIRLICISYMYGYHLKTRFNKFSFPLLLFHQQNNYTYHNSHGQTDTLFKLITFETISPAAHAARHPGTAERTNEACKLLRTCIPRKAK